MGAATAEAVGDPDAPQTAVPIRLGVYSDMAYQSDGDAVYSNRAFVRFIADLPPRVAELVLLGRLDPATARGYYRVPTHLQPGMSRYGGESLDLPGTAEAARTNLALPMGTDLSPETVADVAKAARDAASAVD